MGFRRFFYDWLLIPCISISVGVMLILLIVFMCVRGFDWIIYIMEMFPAPPVPPS